MGHATVGPRLVAADFKHLADAGANWVNISHPGIFAEEPPYGLDHEMLANLERLVSLAHRNRLWCVISYRTGPGRSEFSIVREAAGEWFPHSMVNDGVWFSHAAQAAWAAMWRETASRFGDHPAVAGYQLMVEPNANACVQDGPIWNASTFYARYGNRTPDWNRFYPLCMTAIRAVDRATPILVAGENHASPYWLDRLIPTRDSRSVYAVSVYEPFHYTHQEQQDTTSPSTYPGWVYGPQSTNWVGPDWVDALLDRLQAYKRWQNVPVAVTEIGVQRWQPGAARFMHDYLSGLEARGINYALWLWESSDPRYSKHVTAFNFRLGPDPATTNDAQTNALQDVIETFWQRNTRRPTRHADRAQLKEEPTP